MDRRNFLRNAMIAVAAAAMGASLGRALDSAALDIASLGSVAPGFRFDPDVQCGNYMYVSDMVDLNGPCPVYDLAMEYIVDDAERHIPQEYQYLVETEAFKDNLDPLGQRTAFTWKYTPKSKSTVFRRYEKLERSTTPLREGVMPTKSALTMRSDQLFKRS